MPPAFREEFTCGLHIQVGLAAGPVYAGHLGYAQFKAMVCCAVLCFCMCVLVRACVVLDGPTHAHLTERSGC